MITYEKGLGLGLKCFEWSGHNNGLTLFLKLNFEFMPLHCHDIDMFNNFFNFSLQCDKHYLFS